MGQIVLYINRGCKLPRVNFQIICIGAVYDLHTEFPGHGVVCIHQGLTAPQKERVGPGQMKCASHGRLKAAAVGLHPSADVGGFADG